jgi:hypothetical protein
MYMGHPYYPLWLDNLADNVTGEGAAMQGVAHGAEAVRAIVVEARKHYDDQEFCFTGDFGDNGFIEEYTCRILGEPTSVVVTVHRNNVLSIARERGSDAPSTAPNPSYRHPQRRRDDF